MLVTLAPRKRSAGLWMCNGRLVFVATGCCHRLSTTSSVAKTRGRTPLRCAAGLPEAGRAVHIRIVGSGGGPQALELTMLPLPWDELSANDVMLQVYAAGITEQDVLQRKGLIPHQPGHSPLPGMEVSGRVVALGGKVTDGMLCLGDSVCALTNGGGYSDYAVVPATQCVRLPTGISFAEAACMPLAIAASHGTREIAALEPSLHSLYGVGAGHLACKVLIDSVFSLDDAVDAHCRMEDALHGRVVLCLSGEGNTKPSNSGMHS